MRHRLAYNYRDINVDLVWKTATSDMSALIEALEPLLPKEE